jgi:hypothetical protein
MTVLPNAPIDAATSLPIPTIAIATGGGIAVIHNNGTVNTISTTDDSNYNVCRSVGFTKDYKLIINATYGGANNNVVHVCDIPYVNYSGSTVNARITPLNSRYYHADSSIPNIKSSSGTGLARTASTGINSLVIAHDQAMTFVAEAPETVSGISSNAMVAYVLPTYNTGWMVGNIQGAFLSDSTAETLTGTELITNGTFNTDYSGWTVYAGGSASVSSGRLTVTSPSGSMWAGATQTISNLVIGKRYILTADVITSNNWGSINVSLGPGSGVKYGTYSSWYSSGSMPLKAVAEFVATTTSVTISIDNLNTTNATVTTIDNISMKIADDDRSVINKGVQVIGSITKSAVNTDNDLMAYSGFSTSNYLQAPYNSALDFSTGDFSAMLWFKSNTGTANNQPLFWRGQTTTNGYAMIEVYVGSTYNNIEFITRNAAETTQYQVSGSAAPSVMTQTWRHICCARKNSILYIYVDGVLVASGVTSTNDLTAPTAAKGVLNVGTDSGYTKTLPGSVALLKISATAPSSDQIAKIYNDEKLLFQTGAKACLYGSSAAVTDVTYDDATDLLHVGTSAGRSVFDGLRRVDNTTTAVSASISASNGLVAEQ